MLSFANTAAAIVRAALGFVFGLVAAAWQAVKPYAPALLLVAGGLAAAEIYERAAPWGLAADLRQAVAKAEDWRAAEAESARRATAWKDQADQLADLRQHEGDQARAAADEQQKQCADRVARARASAAAIQSIVTRELPHDANGCPTPGLIDDSELRLAIGQAARP